MLRQGLIAIAALLMTVTAAFAQQPASPPLPDTLQNLAAKGAQIRYLGREKGLDGWITIQNGHEQYFYVTPDGEGILMGVLFDKGGKMVTVRQVQNLQQGNDPTLDTLVTAAQEPAGDPIAKLQEKLQEQAKLSPAEKLFADIEGANTVVLGDEKAPVIYAFMDPQCPHCHEFMNDIRKDYIDAGQLQVRMIPVGLNDETKAQAAYLLAAPDAKDRWYKHLDGDATALPASAGVNLQAVEFNMAIMQNWKLDATPIIVYRSAKGEVKIVRGRPHNIADLMGDLY
ncbi:MAG TPA: thioredoxin domain-containing protein [Alphaproteobacteria bacterium]|jgi:thiol:disulfide interchange protein DsbG